MQGYIVQLNHQESLFSSNCEVLINQEFRGDKKQREYLLFQTAII